MTENFKKYREYVAKEFEVFNIVIEWWIKLKETDKK